MVACQTGLEAHLLSATQGDLLAGSGLMDVNEIERGIKSRREGVTEEQRRQAELMYQGAIDGMLFAQYFCGLMSAFGICDSPEGMEKRDRRMP
jgi:hypothetical protein